MRADRAAGGARRRPHRPRDPEDHRALDRDRQPRGRHVRRPRDPCHGRLGAGRDGRGAGGGHPRAGRGHGRLRRDGGRRDGRGGAGAGARRAPRTGRRSGTEHHGAWSQDGRGGERGAARGSDDRTEAAGGGGAGGGERSPMSAAVTVRVPGSTSNLGAGFDCVGIAIDRWIRVAARREESRAAPITIERRGALAGLALPPERDLLYQGFRSACRAAGREPPPGLVLEASSDIPIARGLGSSAAAVVAGAAAAAGLLALDLSDAALAALCAELEGHPDNVAAAIYGGATLVLRGAAGKLACTPLPVHPSLVLVFAVPDFGVETERARAVLPHVVPHRSAVTAAARSAALVHGLAHADAALLAAGLGDGLPVPHPPPPGRPYDAGGAAARGAGGVGATLSGSGSAIVAVAPFARAAAVEQAMARAWQEQGGAAETVRVARPVGGYETTSQDNSSRRS